MNYSTILTTNYCKVNRYGRVEDALHQLSDNPQETATAMGVIADLAEDHNHPLADLYRAFQQQENAPGVQKKTVDKLPINLHPEYDGYTHFNHGGYITLNQYHMPSNKNHFEEYGFHPTTDGNVIARLLVMNKHKGAHRAVTFAKIPLEEANKAIDYLATQDPERVTYANNEIEIDSEPVTPEEFKKRLAAKVTTFNKRK